MKKIIFICLFVYLFFGLLCHQAFAHVLATDNTIGAILHIDPNDEPIAGEISTFFFTIKDTKEDFSFDKCDCTVMIQMEKKTLFTTQLTDSTFFFTFPKTGQYSLIVDGKPKAGAIFQHFVLHYDVDVDTQKKLQANNGFTLFVSTHVIHFAIGIIILLLVIARLVYLFFVSHHQRSHKEDSKNTQTY